MALLESMATRAALGAFFSRGGFETLLKENRRENIADEFRLAMGAKNPTTAVWSIATKLELSLQHLRTEEISRARRLWVQAITFHGLYSNAQLTNKRKNTAVLLSLCYAYLDEPAYVERALQEMMRDYGGESVAERSEFETMAAAATAMTVGIAVASFLIPAKALINIASRGDVRPEDEVPEITDYNAFAERVRQITPGAGLSFSAALDG